MSDRTRDPEQPEPVESSEPPDEEGVPEELLDAETASYGEREAKAVEVEIARGVALAQQPESPDDEESKETQRMGRLTRAPG